MLSVLLIAMLTAITVWWLLIQRLKDKPWLKQGVIPTSQETVTSSAPKVGLWVFLAVVSSLFGLFASAYSMRMAGHSGLASWQQLDEPNLLWINTLILVLASGAMQVARNRIDNDDLAGGRMYFLGSGLLTVAFLVGQVFAWQQARASGDLGRSTACTSSAGSSCSAARACASSAASMRAT
jgi:cytochrome c oxidase subunit III